MEKNIVTYFAFFSDYGTPQIMETKHGGVAHYCIDCVRLLIHMINLNFFRHATWYVVWGSHMLGVKAQKMMEMFFLLLSTLLMA